MLENKNKLLLTLGARENEVLKEIPYLVRNGKFPDNKNEIFRRGFLAARQLVDVNEKPLLELLLEKIERAAKNLSEKDFELILALSLVLYGTYIVKKGVLASEPFGTIPNTFRQLELSKRADVNQADVSKTLKDMASVVGTIFLKNSYDLSKNLTFNPPNFKPQKMIQK